MGYFDELIEHLNRKKPKKDYNGYFGKPIIKERDKLLLVVEYNYYYVTVLYDPLYKMPRPPYHPYKLSIEKPCVINHYGGQELGTAFYEHWCRDLDDVWQDLQNKWRKTL